MQQGSRLLLPGIDMPGASFQISTKDTLVVKDKLALGEWTIAVDA